jgi:AcrR family transcriptional regulator
MPPHPVQSKGEKSRQAFLAAGRAVFLRDGYPNAEINEIAREAGKSSGTFYIYFNNKSDLLAAMFAEFLEDTEAVFTLHPENWYASITAADWRGILVNMFTVYRAHTATFYALSQAAIVEPHFDAVFQELRQRTMIDFEKIIKARKKQGFCKNIDPKLGARALENTVLHSMYDWLASPISKCKNKRAEAKAFETVCAIFDSVLGA